MLNGELCDSSSILYYIRLFCILQYNRVVKRSRGAVCVGNQKVIEHLQERIPHSLYSLGWRRLFSYKTATVLNSFK